MPLELELIVFLVATLGIAWVSRASLRDLRSHGFYRFFGWEAILIAILLNLEVWFRRPWSALQVASWLLLALSLVLAIDGFRRLETAGRPDGRRPEKHLLDLEKTTELVTTGSYRYIRHPLYCSLLCLAWGAFLKRPSWPGLALAALATLFLTVTAKIEETENIRYFGDV